MKLSKINIKIHTKTKEECIQKINFMNSLDNIETIDVTPCELAELINNGYSISNAVFNKNQTVKKPVWETWSKTKSLRKQAVDEFGNKIFKEVYNRTIENVEYAETISFDIENEYGIEYSIDDIKSDLKEKGFDFFNLIYETYSHGSKGHRYRLIGTLDKKVSIEEYEIIYKYIFSTFVRKNEDKLLTLGKPKLYDKIYLADISCIDISKINFPGKVVEINTTNIINVEDVLKRIKEDDFNFIERIYIKEKKYSPINKTQKRSPIKREQSLNVDSILDYLYEFGKIEMDYNYRYLIFSDMFKLSDLINEPLNEFFNCILPEHIDENASSYIYIDTDGFEKYHCWGCNKRYNVIQFIKEIFEEELGSMTDFQFFKYIEENTLIKFGTPYQKESYNTLCAMQDKIYTVQYNNDLEKRRQVGNRIAKREGIKTNNRKRRKNDFEKKEELVFNYLSSKKIINFYNNFLIIARNNISLNPLVKDDFNRFSFFYSIRALSDNISKMTGINHNTKVVQDKLKSLAKIGLIEYVGLDKLDDITRIKAIEYKKKNSYKNHINFFIINDILNEEVITNSVNIIENFNGIRNKSTRDMTFEQVYRDLGKEQAYKMYPQYKGVLIELEDKNYKHLKKVIDKLLLENEGYFTEDMLKKKMNKKFTVKEKDKIIKTYINQLMKEMSLIYTKVNKNVRDSFHTIPNTITNKQYVYIKKKSL